MKQTIRRLSALTLLNAIRPNLSGKVLSLQLMIAAALVITSVSMATAQPGSHTAENIPLVSSAELDATLEGFFWFPHALNMKPQFNNYLECFNGNVYVDFFDPDGDDAALDVIMVTTTQYGNIPQWLNVSDSGAHGVFFWTDNLIPGALQYAFRAIDSEGGVSAWITADAGCNLY